MLQVYKLCYNCKICATFVKCVKNVKSVTNLQVLIAVPNKWQGKTTMSCSQACLGSFDSKTTIRKNPVVFPN